MIFWVKIFLEEPETRVDIEALECLMDSEDEEVSLRYILKYATRGGSNIFQLFDTAEKSTVSWPTEGVGWSVKERR